MDNNTTSITEVKPTRLESDILKDARKEIEAFKLSDEDEKAFQKLLKLRTSINSAFTDKYRINTMKQVLKENDVVKFAAPRFENIDRVVPVFRFTMNFPEDKYPMKELSDAATNALRSKKAPADDNEGNRIMDEITRYRSYIISQEIFSVYINKLMTTFENYFSQDPKIKQDYQKNLEEIFERIPENQVKEFICSGIFRLRFDPNTVNTGQFEFVF